MLKLCASVVAVVGFTFGASARGDEEKVPLDKLPAKVREAVKAKFPDAELVSASKEVEDKVLLYEVNIKNKKQTIEVTVTEDGKIVEVEYEITPADLPKAVTDALAKKYGKLRFLKAEDIVKGEKKYYEVLIEHAGGAKKTEVQIDRDGKILEEEDKTKEKGDKTRVRGVQRRFVLFPCLGLRDRCCRNLLGCRMR